MSYLCSRLDDRLIGGKELTTMQIERHSTLAFDTQWPIDAIRETLMGARRVVLVAHTNADGDAVGSLVGMGGVLRRKTKAEVTLMLPDGCPEDMSWLPGTEFILAGNSDMERCREAIGHADVVVGLDISGLSRTGVLEQPLRAAATTRLLVDHHIGPEKFDLVVSEPDASSTCELVYWLTTMVFGRDALDCPSATALYTGMCTDTGTFSYSNDKPSLYYAAADLLSYGIDPMYINRCIKNIFTVERLQFFGYAIAHRLEVFPDSNIALMTLTAKDMEEHHVKSHELTGLINEVMRLRDTDCGILVREEDGKVRLSLRSKVKYDVNRIASDLFGGGGHERAAGATSLLSLEETVARVKEWING